MKEIQRQDIKTMIDRLDTISTGDDIEDHIINSAISMLEDLGNLVRKLQEKKKTQKEYYEVVFNDGANRIKNLMRENAKLEKDIINLKHEIIHLEAMIDD